MKVQRKAAHGKSSVPHPKGSTPPDARVGDERFVQQPIGPDFSGTDTSGRNGAPPDNWAVPGLAE